MSRASGQKDYVSLVRGLITEASVLSFPEGATTDELNMQLDKDGLIRKRRKGLAADVNKVENLLGVTYRIENTQYWQEPDLILFVITRVSPTADTRVRIHKNDSNMTLVGNVTIADSVASTQFAVQTNTVVLTTSVGQEPIVFEYDDVANEIEVSSVSIQIRDFELVDDGLRLTERPGFLTDNHKYNLYNAGWYKDRRYQYALNQAVQDPISSFFSSVNDPSNFGSYPSNADLIVLGIGPNENGVTTFRDDEVRNNNVGNTESPRGHYIYDINDFDRDARLTSKEIDGSLSSTLTSITTLSL